MLCYGVASYSKNFFRNNNNGHTTSLRTNYADRMSQLRFEQPGYYVPRPFALKPALMSGLGLTGDLNIIACWEHDRPGTISPAQATPALLKSLRTSDYCVELVLVGNKSAWWISKNDKTQWKSHRFSFMAFAKPCSALIKNIDARYGVSRGCRQWGCDKMVNTKTNRMHAAKPDAMIALEEVRLSFQL